MKVKDSPYLRANKPLFQKLLAALLERYPYASILASDIREKSYRVNRVTTSLAGGGIFSGRGFVVKVFDGGHWSEHSFNQISEELLPSILEQIGQAAALRRPPCPRA